MGLAQGLMRVSLLMLVKLPKAPASVDLLGGVISENPVEIERNPKLGLSRFFVRCLLVLSHDKSSG